MLAACSRSQLTVCSTFSHLGLVATPILYSLSIFRFFTATPTSQLTAVSAALISVVDMPGTILVHCAILLISTALLELTWARAAVTVPYTGSSFFSKLSSCVLWPASRSTRAPAPGRCVFSVRQPPLLAAADITSPILGGWPGADPGLTAWPPCCRGFTTLTAAAAPPWSLCLLAGLWVWAGGCSCRARGELRGRAPPCPGP